MLVCNVSLRPPRAGITADVTEVASAVDASATGFVVFATLVDDPASVRDHVDAYSGEIMLEAASAAAAVNAGLTYAARIDEAVTAATAQDGRVPAVYAVAIAEAVTAIAVPNATIVSAGATTTTISQRNAGPWMVVVTDTVIDAGKFP